MNYTGIITSALERAELEALCRRGAERAADLGQPVLVSLTSSYDGESDPLVLFGRAGEAGGPEAPRSLWLRPELGFWLVGHGAAAVSIAAADEPVEAVKKHYQELLATAVVEGPEAEGTGPVVCGGFPFDPQTASDSVWRGFSPGRFTLPQFLFSRSEGRRWLTINTIAKADTDIHLLTTTLLQDLHRLEAGPVALRVQPRVTKVIEDFREEWRRRVETALAGIEAGTLSKVVLSRRRELKANGAFSPEVALDYLARAYPSCAIFAVGHGEAVFLGASPEDLASVSDGQLAVTCLASSAPRGATAEEDRKYQRYLLEDSKERREHAAVAGMLADTLRDVCRELHWQEEPQVMKLKNIQHLCTPFAGRLRPGVHILDVIHRLHPTPAVGGVPTTPALELIRELEGDRGLYAAPIGWFDRNGGGDFIVGIRSALLRSDTAYLFAGCGIVAGSEPDREYRETELKFQPLATALAPVPAE